nr:MAG TPA: hypothetical protein [Caudoviricetes sp.]
MISEYCHPKIKPQNPFWTRCLSKSILKPLRLKGLKGARYKRNKDKKMRVKQNSLKLRRESVV